MLRENKIRLSRKSKSSFGSRHIFFSKKSEQSFRPARASDSDSNFCCVRFIDCSPMEAKVKAENDARKELTQIIEAALHKETCKSASVAFHTSHTQTAQSHHRLNGLQCQLQSLKVSIN